MSFVCSMCIDTKKPTVAGSASPGYADTHLFRNCREIRKDKVQERIGQL
jgi:hypothetical protein